MCPPKAFCHGFWNTYAEWLASKEKKLRSVFESFWQSVSHTQMSQDHRQHRYYIIADASRTLFHVTTSGWILFEHKSSSCSWSSSNELEQYWGHSMYRKDQSVWTLKELQKHTYHCCWPKQLSMPYMLMCKRLWVWHVGEVYGRCWLVCCRGNQILCHRQRQVAAAPQ